MTTKKIVHLSDTHFGHQFISVPDGDVLVHSGDALWRGEHRELIMFAQWFKALPHPIKIFVPGNHDRIFEDHQLLARQEMGDSVHVLINQEMNLFGKKVWGSPYTPMFNNWSFMRYRGPLIKDVWDMIPADTDILITHGPPHGILDHVPYTNSNAGCEELMLKFKNKDIKPEIHMFGHIHESYGQLHQDGVSYYNSALMAGASGVFRPAQVIDLVIGDADEKD